MELPKMSQRDKERFFALTDENMDYIRTRYNRINRWVIGDLVRRSAYRYPDKPALIFGDRVLTYQQLEEAANRFANALLDMGLRKYDRVAILAHNTIHHVITWLGTAKAGGIYLAINYLLRGKDISYCINHSESRFFVVEDALFHLVEDVLSEMPGVEKFIWSNEGEGRPAPEGWLEFDEWYEASSSEEPDVKIEILDPVQMTYTSGTESLPK